MTYTFGQFVFFNLVIPALFAFGAYLVGRSRGRKGK